MNQMNMNEKSPKLIPINFYRKNIFIGIFMLSIIILITLFLNQQKDIRYLKNECLSQKNLINRLDIRINELENNDFDSRIGDLDDRVSELESR
jgi:hypothetical protein